MRFQCVIKFESINPICQANVRLELQLFRVDGSSQTALPKRPRGLRASAKQRINS